MPDCDTGTDPVCGNTPPPPKYFMAVIGRRSLTMSPTFDGSSPFRICTVAGSGFRRRTILTPSATAAAQFARSREARGDGVARASRPRQPSLRRREGDRRAGSRWTLSLAPRREYDLGRSSFGLIGIACRSPWGSAPSHGNGGDGSRAPPPRPCLRRPERSGINNDPVDQNLPTRPRPVPGPVGMSARRAKIVDCRSGK